jgi:hypothetical protein
MRDLKIGGDKGIPQSRVSFASSYQIVGTNNSNETLKSIQNTSVKPKIVFNTSNEEPTITTPSSPYDYNYNCNFDSSYQHGHMKHGTVRPQSLMTQNFNVKINQSISQYNQE